MQVLGYMFAAFVVGWVSSHAMLSFRRVVETIE